MPLTHFWFWQSLSNIFMNENIWLLKYTFGWKILMHIHCKLSIILVANFHIITDCLFGYVSLILTLNDQPSVPLTVFRSNSKFHPNLQCSGLKRAVSITTNFLHTSRQNCDRPNMIWTRALQSLIELRMAMLLCNYFYFHYLAMLQLCGRLTSILNDKIICDKFLSIAVAKFVKSNKGILYLNSPPTLIKNRLSQYSRNMLSINLQGK